MHFFLRLPAIIRYSLTFSDKKSQISYPVKKLKHFIIDLEQFQFRNSSPKKILVNLVSISGVHDWKTVCFWRIRTLTDRTGPCSAKLDPK